MANTRFGEMIRIQRIKNHETMIDTAKLFNVSLPYVSMVENGKKGVPEEWYEILVDHYKFNEEEQAELKKAIEESKTHVKLNLSATSELKRAVAFQFQRSFDDLDENTAKEILDLLKGDQ